MISHHLPNPPLDKDEPSSSDVPSIIMMRPLSPHHGKKMSFKHWILLIGVMIATVSVLWPLSQNVYAQYQAMMLAEQLAKQAQAQKAVEAQEKIRQALQARVEQQVRLHELQLKEAEATRLAWQSYDKSQERNAKNNP